MPKDNKILKPDQLPENFTSLEEFWKFWDTHSTSDYEDMMEDIDIQIDAHSSRVYCTVAKDLAAQLRAQARKQGVSTETLINLWLREKISGSAQID